MKTLKILKQEENKNIKVKIRKCPICGQVLQDDQYVCDDCKYD